eukprot:gb/GEZJ01006933.1/.p1 GENE.gb/GEZJ01006933.1/~~gb/GEZJ01006933.1/.p1  ORF type:complete len:141 (-),score=8.71 gb/GEZJ01006933.1/:146-568(-)
MDENTKQNRKRPDEDSACTKQSSSEVYPEQSNASLPFSDKKVSFSEKATRALMKLSSRTRLSPAPSTPLVTERARDHCSRSECKPAHSPLSSPFVTDRKPAKIAKRQRVALRPYSRTGGHAKRQVTSLPNATTPRMALDE